MPVHIGGRSLNDSKYANKDDYGNDMGGPTSVASFIFLSNIDNKIKRTALGVLVVMGAPFCTSGDD